MFAEGAGLVRDMFAEGAGLKSIEKTSVDADVFSFFCCCNGYYIMIL